MTSTPDLIRALAGDLTPVRRLRPPLLRASFWLALAVLVLALLAISQGTRPDLFDKLHDPVFAGRLVGALATGIAASVAAFMLSLPDRSKWWLALPVPPLALWVANIGYQCLTNWVTLDPAGISLGETARCFATLVLTSLPLSLVMLLMLKHAAALRPLTVAMTGGLAVGALTAVALSLFHELDASVLIVVWNIGTAALMVGLSSLIARRLARRPRAPLAG